MQLTLYVLQWISHAKGSLRPLPQTYIPPSPVVTFKHCYGSQNDTPLICPDSAPPPFSSMHNPTSAAGILLHIPPQLHKMKPSLKILIPTYASFFKSAGGGHRRGWALVSVFKILAMVGNRTVAVDGAMARARVMARTQDVNCTRGANGL